MRDEQIITDDWIIANYENYIKDGCNNIEKDLLDLAKRQKAEIERLKKSQVIEIHINKELYNECQHEIKQAKFEAYKEFAEKWTVDLEKYRNMLIEQPILVQRAFEIAIATTKEVLEELTEGEIKP